MPLDLEGGSHAGPLFIAQIKRPAKKDLHKSGWARRRIDHQAAPPWADTEEVAAIYRECKRMNKRDGPKSWAVDHIVPLNHPTVCGLHIGVNLQIISYNENQLKSNNWWPDMWMVQCEFNFGE